MNLGTMDPGFDQRIAEWLEGDPNDAPDVVLTTVLAAFPSIPQRRRMPSTWRPASMNRFLIAAAVAATVVAMVLGSTSFVFLSRPPSIGPPGSPSASASVAASPTASASSPPGGSTSPSPEASSGIPPMTERVTSPSGRLTIRFPHGWSVLDAPGSTGAELRPASGQNADAFFSGSEAQLPDGQTPEQWLASREGGCPGGGAGFAPREIDIGGQVGILKSSACSILGARLHYLAVIVVNGRGYTFHMDSRVWWIDATWFSAMLAAVVFET